MRDEARSTDPQNKVYGAVQREPIDPGSETQTTMAALMAGDKSEATNGVVTPEPTKPAVAAPASSRPRWYHDGISWALVGVGVVGGAVGGGFVIHASSRDDQAARETNFDERARLRDSASSPRTTGTIVAAIGGAVLMGAIVKLALVPDPPPSSKTALRVLPGPGDAGLTLSTDL